MRNPKRPFFNFASKHSSNIKEQYESFVDFKSNWELPNILLDDFILYLEEDSIEVNKDSLLLDKLYIENQLKSELAGSIWGKNESANIRLATDNQVLEALKHFDEADAFIKSIN